MALPENTQVEQTIFAQRLLAPASADIELLHNNANDSSLSEEGFSLPPTDGGKDAWLCLFACFMLEAMIWGRRSSREVTY